MLVTLTTSHESIAWLKTYVPSKIYFMFVTLTTPIGWLKVVEHTLHVGDSDYVP